MNIGICDDDTGFTDSLAELISDIVPGERVSAFPNGFTLLDYITDAGDRLDMLFLDMKMPRLDGLDTARELRQVLPGLPIVVVTSYPQYALPCYDFFPIHFLLKPIEPKALKLCIDRAKRSTVGECLVIRSRDKLRYIPLRDIFSMESDGENVKITVGDGHYSIIGALNYYDERLTGKGFFRIRRNTLINLSYVQEITGNRIMLDNGRVLIVAKRRKAGFMSALLEWRKAYA